MLKETEPETWLNSGAGDFVAQLKPPDLSNLVDKVIEAEATYTHWSLFNRFCMANDILDAADAAGDDHPSRCAWACCSSRSSQDKMLLGSLDAFGTGLRACLLSSQGRSI